MKRSGIADLPLHGGHAPRWLFRRMVKLADEIAYVIVDEYGPRELLKRISDPFWFQAFGCLLGYDWHSSGVTTVVCGALREALKPEKHGVVVCGGKGARSWKTPEDIERAGDAFGLSTKKIEELKRTSRLVAKVDNAALQDGYQLYHHTLVLAESGEWAVIQQGMCPDDKTARRYHWLSANVRSFVEEPHAAIAGDVVRSCVLNMVSKSSREARKASVDLVKEKPKRLLSTLRSIRPMGQRSLVEWTGLKERIDPTSISYLKMPRSANWELLKRLYEIQPKNYEELLLVKGVGPSFVRALAYVSSIIFGCPLEWRDPVKYSFALGGKDGVPFPVRKQDYDKVIEYLREAIMQAKLTDRDRYEALRRVKRLVERIAGKREKR